MADKIEILSTDILKEHRELADELMKMSRTLALSSGWHYILDWIWVISHIEHYANKTFIDAGAGIGLLQWYLASRGGRIISVDRSDRTCIPFHLLEKFNVSGYTVEHEPLAVKELLNLTNQKASLASRMKAMVRGLIGQWHLRKDNMQTPGNVQIYNQDLRDLSEIPDASADVIVSISALEHNEKITTIKEIIEELERKLIPGGKMLITLPASFEGDWFFAPAYSWCFSEKTLRNLFGLPENTPSNFHIYPAVLKQVRNSDELRKNLSWRYFIQPNSGMPWGKWDPKYLPVGIVKTKQAQN